MLTYPQCKIRMDVPVDVHRNGTKLLGKRGGRSCDDSTLGERDGPILRSRQDMVWGLVTT